MYYKSVFLFLQILISFTHSELSLEKKDKLLNGFIDFYNNLPHQVYTCEEGSLQNAEHLTDNYYTIEVSLQVADVHNLDSVKYIKCTARIQDHEGVVTVVNNEHHCQDTEHQPVAEEVVVTESPFVRRPVQLDNEVETNTAVTSGEQFIAVPREDPGAPCIGCATHINPQAAGVTELATLGVRHIDLHEPNVRHSLNSVIDVERQVQVTNGVRYILTLLVDYNTCSETQTESCTSSNTCKISILEKPWVRLPRGGKYRAIVANNCTEEWQFGDNGEVIAEGESNNRENNDIHPKKDNTGDDIITAVHTDDVQAQQNQDKILTDDQVKKIEEQIIPHNEFNQRGAADKFEQSTLYPHSESSSKEHAVKELETPKYYNENSINQPSKNEKNSLTDEKKKTIEELMNFFEFSAFGSERNNEKNTRAKRSYDHDLDAMLLADDFQTLHKSIKNGKYLYSLAQIMVDYLNEMDLAVKTRTLKDVVKAEDEIVNYQHFYYIQARVLIPCDKAVCDSKDTTKKICNGIIEGTDRKHPHVLTAFCYNEREDTELNKVNTVPLDDPLLHKLIKESVKKIEKESSKPNALNVTEIISANTQRVSGTLTKIAIILEYLNCTKDTRMGLRKNCTTVNDLGSNVCEVVIHERHKLKERQIIYNCIERPIDTRYADQSKMKKTDIDDAKVKEMVQEALQYLELQSNRNNKQKVVAINSVETELNAGLVTKIEFLVGYTSCSSNTEVDLSNCPLLAAEPLRKCNTQIWDRTWIEDGRQVEVICDDTYDIRNNNAPKQRQKRSFYGGQESKDVNDPLYKTLAEESLSNYLKTSGGQQHFNLVKLDHVDVQLVAGKLTRIDFTISPTDCQVDSDGKPSSSNCSVKDPDDVATCHSEIWERPWLQSEEKQVTVDCLFSDFNNREKRSLRVGGKTEQNPSDPIYNDLAKKSLNKYLQNIGTSKPHEVLRVDKVTTQVVSGIQTEIHFSAVPTDQNSGDVIRCVSKVWEQPWRGMEEINVNCYLNNKVYRAKRHTLLGGQTEQDPSKSEYKQLAEESMQKYLESVGSTKPHKLVSVRKVTTQVVSGIKYRLDFVISPVAANSDDVISCHSEIWEQSWLNKKEFTVDCKLNNQKYRAKRATVPGGETEQDPSKSEYKQLAEESMQKYLESVGSTKAHKMVKVEKVTTQVVSGIKYRLDFVISPVAANSGDVISCHSEIWEQSWLNKKEFTVDCKLNNQKYRAKRATVTGGETEQDPTDPTYVQLAEESMQQYLESVGSTIAHKVVTVDKVTTQVVSGIKTKIDFVVAPVDGSSSDVIRCNSEIWEQAWNDIKEITVECLVNEQKYRAKRNTLVGGQTEQDPSKSEYKQLAEESMQKYLESVGSTKPHKLVSVQKVTSQVVSGIKYRLDFVISPVAANSGDVISCHSEIWEQSWLNKKEFTVDCKLNNQKYRAKRATVPGGETEQDPSKSEYKQLAEESMQKYLESVGSTKAHKMVKVEKVTTQVVSGIKYRLDFVISPVAANSGDVISCHSEIWEQSWLNKKEFTVDCKLNNQKYRAKRATVPGGETEQDPSKSEYKQLAEESMQKYLESVGSTKAHKMVKVEKVTTQVVSGIKYRLDFVISPVAANSGDVISCHSEIWEQSWLNKKEFTVDCKLNNQKYRAKRATVTGGETEQDPTDPTYVQLAEESMQQYLESVGSTIAHKVVNVDKVTTQVVSGIKTKIDFVVAPVDGSSSDVITCNSEIWEQAWNDIKEITVECLVNEQKYRAKRNTLVGGQTEQDPSKSEYKQLAEESMQKYLESVGSTKPHKLVSVQKVTSQVVSGIKYRLDFVISPVAANSGDVISCHSEIWEQSWLNKKEFTVDCKLNNQKYRAKRATVPGGETEQDPSKSEYKQLAEESMQKYLASVGSTKAHKMVKVEKVTTQVVSGIKYRLDFVISPVAANSGDVISCHSEIWEQPWLNKKEFIVDCKLNNQKYRAKRATVKGGEKEQDPSKSEYKQLAEESMQKYLESVGSTKAHKMVKVEKVTTQVVSGIKYRLDFVISPVAANSGDVISCHSEIWEQSWLNKKEFTVDCKLNNQKYRAKREIVTGGETEQDPSEPEYRQLAEESMQKYLESVGSTKPHRLVSVQRATTQVVSGVKYRLDFVISPITGNSGDVISCHSSIWEQWWLKKKEFTVDCKLNNQKYRAKRATVPGGETEQDPSKSEYKQLAEESMQKYLESVGSTKAHKMVKVEKVTTQVVSGIKYRLDFVISPVAANSGDVISCHSEIWEQSWLNKKEFTVDCKLNNQKYRAKRATVTGGETEQDPTDPTYVQLAEESMQQYLESVGSTIAHKVVNVDKVTTQVVSGIKTKIDFVVAPVDGSSSDVITCNSEIWEQAWNDIKEITVECLVNEQKYRAKRNTLVGGQTEQDPSKSEYKQLAEESMQKYLESVGSTKPHKLVSVQKVTSQVVSGIKYRLDFVISPIAANSGDVISCHSEIWEQAWLNKKEFTVDCKLNNQKYRAKREAQQFLNQEKRKSKDIDFEGEILGNEIEANLKDKRQVLDDEEVIDEELKYYYADRAMQHINQASNTNNLDKLISIHAVDSSVHMGANMVRLYVETAPTFCLKNADEGDLPACEEIDGVDHKLCLARLWPSPDDELVVQSVSVVCDDDRNFASVTGLSIPGLLKASIKELEDSRDQKYKLVHLGDPQVIPSLDSRIPNKLSFIVGFTNCTKDVDINKRPFNCFLDSTKTSKPCTSYIWFVPNSRDIQQIDVICKNPGTRKKRSVSMNLANATADDIEIHKLVQESLEKLEMSSIHRYKQRVILINSYSTKITTGKVTTIDFDVGYTSCLKYEWVNDITTCEFLEHLPRRHCVSHVFERLWLRNGRNIEVTCEDDETPLEAHIEFESAEMAMQLAKEALKHIEAKYPHPRKQKVVRIFSLEKQVVAGIHYRLKVEIGLTDCSALSAQTDCKLVKDEGLNKFCRVNVWLRPWTDHPPNYRVTCDYHEAATADVYHQLQAEHLFYDFLSTYKPNYINDRIQMRQRFDIFKENVKKMHELNTHERGTATYGVTRFADLTYEEFSTRHMGLKSSLRDPNQVPFSKADIPKVALPDSFDWRDHGAVTEVKDQGSCGSCWAFSVTGNIEGQWKVHSGDLVSLSEQELVDCDKLDQGCNGGLPDNAYRAIEELGGLETESDYPYEGSDDKCSFNKTLARVKISGAVNITSNETDMAKWLVKNGPISIGINANAMQFYMGGISHPWRMLCNPSNLDHGVLIVGFGSKDYPLFHKHLPYWTIKNSWGTSWGEQGYYRVYRGDGTCGVNQMASSAVV